MAENRCKNCQYCDIITDKDYCKRLKCMNTKSKNGKTITWSMCGFSGNTIMHLAQYLETHRTPKWCPLENKKKSGENNEDLLSCDN